MKVLYITANPKAVEYSHSLSVGERFIEEYLKNNREDEVVRIDLFEKNVPNIDYDVMGAWGKLANGVTFDLLTESEQQKLSSMNSNLEEFMNADKYVFVSPLWNFGLPPVLKAYIDNLLISGKTFRYTETGPLGLLLNKKSLVIQASGGIYTNDAMKDFEHGSNFLKVPLNFIGINDQHEILIEGVNMSDDNGMAIRQKNMEIATELGKVF
jgi:FMN-dependent NADH-azoreductase